MYCQTRFQGGIKMEYTQEEILEILKKHREWLAGSGGSRADLSDADLNEADLREADLREANLSGAYLCDANLFDTNLSGANLSYAHLDCANLYNAKLIRADLSHADLNKADLRSANLCEADLSSAGLFRANLSCANLFKADLDNACLDYAKLIEANLFNANLSGVDLRHVDLRNVDLSGVKGLLNPIEYIMENFENTEDGIIVYKSFGEQFPPNPNWEIAKGSIIEEVVNPSPNIVCGCGINVATKEWAERNINPVWKCLIRWEWLAGVVVPYQTEGQIRASRVQLIKPI
ncbi:MAG TPA: pentapeptide repeat-containing protein [Clostridiales bacterium]|nr:pentapeptide repeat-containing protein [Clostridiales bacterium]